MKKADPDGELLNAVRKLGIADNYETLTEPVGDFLADLRPEQRRSILDKAGAGRAPGGTGKNARRGQNTHEGLEVDSGSDNLKNSTDPSILFQSIGPDGAQHLDQTEETKIRIDNLSAAREMEKAGRDARAVRLATGWERGTDGKWRYEIPDIEIRKNAKFEDVTADVLGEKEEYKKIKLADLIDDKGGLLKAYPELAGYDLIVQRMDSGTTGYMDVKNKAVIINRSVFLHDTEEYASKENSIENTPEWKEWTTAYNDESGTPEEQEKRIDEADKKFYATEVGKSYISNNRGAGKTEFKITDESRSVLIHELQHAVQTFEGFAKGGSLNTRSYAAREYV